MTQHNRPATSAAEYAEATRDANKQRELHPSDCGAIDLDAFALMSRDAQRATWLVASDADRLGLALQILRSRNHGPDAESIGNVLAALDAKFGSDQAIPEADALLVACAERAERRPAEAARYGRLADALLAGARLAWSGGDLLVVSDSGARYRVSAAGCDCPNRKSRRPSCWHLLARELLTDLLEDRADAADEVDAMRQLGSRIAAARSRVAA